MTNEFIPIYNIDLKYQVQINRSMEMHETITSFMTN